MSGVQDVFISYGRADSKDFAATLCNRLTALGLEVWYDQHDIPLGVDFQSQINAGIEKAHNFLFSYLSSRHIPSTRLTVPKKLS